MVLALLVLAPLLASDPPRPGYDFEVLSTPAQGDSQAYAVGTGSFVGGRARPFGGYRACIWVDGAPQYLAGGNVYAINGSGSVLVGENSTYETYWRYDSHDGSYTSLPAPAGGRSSANDLNDFAFAVGVASIVPGGAPSMAILWDRQGNPQQLGALGGVYSSAFALNERGWIVGTFKGTVGARRPFLHRDGVMTELQLLHGDPKGWASDVNNRGMVVGVSSSGAHGNRVVLWRDGAGEPLYLGVQAGTPRINDRGQVLAGKHLWVSGQLFRVKALAGQLPKGFQFGVARDLDGDGRIAGHGKYGYQAAWVMTPKVANVNLDATVDRDDVRAFVAAYLRGEEPADVNADERVDLEDVRAFVEAYRTGS